MFYRRIFMFFATFWMLPIFAQERPNWGRPQEPGIVGKIQGTIIDSASGVPVPFASVALMLANQDKIINGAISTENGSFKIENVTPGKYQIAITCIGYRDFMHYGIMTSKSQPDATLGKILLPSDIRVLAGVDIVEQGAVVEHKIDRIVYNADKDVPVAGGDATDILRKVPLLSVDLDGNVELRGSQNIKVLINGKPSGMMAASTSDALKALPADLIKSVEVITNPGVRYDAEGTGGIVNIITKKTDLEGINGTASLGVSTKNNTANASLNVRHGRLGWNIGGGGMYNIRKPGTSEFYRSSDNGGGIEILKQLGEFIGARNGFNANAGMDYDINAYHNINIYVRGNGHQFRGTNSMDVFSGTDPLTLTKTAYRESDNRRTNWNMDIGMDYKHTWDTKDREWLIGLQFNPGINDNSYTLSYFQPEPKTPTYFQKNGGDGSNNEYSISTDYVHPMGAITWETGAKAQLRKASSNSSFYYDSLNGGGLLRIPAQDQDFSYDQQVLAGYTGLGWNITPKWMIKGGVRYERTDVQGTVKYQGNFNPPAYGNWIPSATLVYNLTPFNAIKLSYSRRLSRPRMNDLNPFINASDPNNISQGNPYLGPELTHNLELGSNILIGRSLINTQLYYRNTSNVIQGVLVIDTQSISITTQQNVGKDQSTGISLFGSVDLIKNLSFRGNLNLFYSFLDGVIQGAKLHREGFNYGGNVTIQYKLESGWLFESFGNLRSPRITLQGKTPVFSMMTLGAKKELWKKKGTLGIFITNPFVRDIVFRTDNSGPGFTQYNANYVNFRGYGVNFSYNFGKFEAPKPRKKQKGGEEERGGEMQGF